MEAAGGEEWSVFVAWPGEPAPPAGYPVLCLVDANASFVTLVESIRARAHRPASTGVAPAVVVGVGYPLDAPPDRERRSYDLTEGPPAPPARAFSRPHGRARPVAVPEAHADSGAESSSTCGEGGRPGDAASFRRTGGAARLRAFLRDSLLPAIERDFPIDPARRALFGHSLGGLFVLQTLFAEPGAFASYVAVSPSVWWDRERLLAGADAVARSGVCARVLLSVGEYEMAPAPWQMRGDPAELSALRRRRSERRMLDDTEELVRRLMAVPESRIRARHDVIAGEDHASVVPVAIGRALRVVLAP